MTKSAYIHIPFCKSKCHYCSFVSFSDLSAKDDYVAALKCQIQAQYKGEGLDTIYFGGGTPSVLSVDDFNNLIALFNFNQDAEITVEVNPEGLEKDYLNALHKLGVNRISIGSQSFDDKILKLIGRRHTSEQIATAVGLAKKAGFANISLDLIYGLPTQTIKGFESDLLSIVDLNIQHVSLYGLKIEEGCYFDKVGPDALPDFDQQADMYLNAVEILSGTGFEHYEISNFAKTGFVSRHNLNYWNNSNYFGFGLSASGYLDGVRFTNEIKLQNYISNPLSISSEQKLSQNEILEEEIFLGFRRMSGIDVDLINKKFNIDFESKYCRILKKYLATGHLIKTQKGYALSVGGVLVSNEILSEFIE